MPVIKSAKKKLHQDKKATIRNAKQEAALKDAIKEARKNPTAKTVSAATSLTDKAAKRFIIHKNKAARLKSALSKLLSPKGTSYTVAAGGGKDRAKAEKTVAKPAAKAAPKKAVKTAKKASVKKK